MQNKTLFKTTLIIMMLIVFGKVIAFGKDIVISTYFGAGLTTDAFFIALNITSVLFVSFYSTVSLVFLPLYNNVKIKFTIPVSNLFTSNIITIYLGISFFIMLLTVYFSNEIVSLFNASQNIDNINMTIFLLRIMAFSLIFNIFIAFMTVIELSNEQYLAPHIVPIFNNLFVVIAIVLFAPKYGIYAPAVAGVIAWILQVPLHKWIVRNFYKYTFYISIKDIHVKKMGVLFLPAFLGVSIDQTNILVDTILASGLQEGSVSALNYSNRLISFSSGIFVMAIMSIMYPMFSKYIANDEHEKLYVSIQTGIRLLLLVMLPIMAIILTYNYEIVSIVFERGKFDEDATEITSSVFFFYGIGIIFLALRELFNKVFYSLKNTKTPLFISFFAVSINIILSIILVKSMGVEGLALASSISLIVYVILQLLILNNKIGKEFYQGIIPFIGKLALSLLVSLYLMLKFKEYSNFDSVYLTFILGSCLGILCYVIFLFFLKNEEVIFLYSKIQKKLKDKD